MNRIDNLYNDIGVFITEWPKNILIECGNFIVNVAKTPFFRKMIHDARVIIDEADDILNG